MNIYEISSDVMELSEHKTYIELTRRLCYYDYPNANGVQLNSDTAEEKAQSLLMQPVVAKYKKIANKDDLGGHECSVDSKGNVTFGTIPIGVNVSVEVKKDTVNINDIPVETPCLFAVSRIWKRNKNVCSAIKRLFAEKKLHSSWEIIAEKTEYKDNVKILTDYVFEADALLGSATKPAYGDCAATLCVASTVLANAIADDFDTKSDINPEIAKKNEAIIKADEEIASLRKYKEMFEKAEKEKAEKELSEKKENLKKYAVKSGYISADEIETSEEIKKLIDNADENGIKALIVDRLMSQKSADVSKTPEVASLTCDDVNISVSDYKSVMQKFLGK